MPIFLITILKMFAGPLGALINKGLTAGSAALIAYGAAKGWNNYGFEMIVSEAALGLSALITWGASTQGVQIPRINDDKTNGVVVVSASDANTAKIEPVSAPGK